MKGPPVEVGQLLRVGQLADLWSRNRETVRRMLMALWEKDRAADKHHPGKELKSDWLILGNGPRSRNLINVHRLRARHPMLFTARAVSREEHDVLAETVRRLGDQQVDLRKKLNAHGGAIRDLNERCEEAMRRAV